MSKMLPLSVIVLMVLFLGGCAPTYVSRWDKQGASQDDFMKDRFACLQQAQQPAYGSAYNAYGGSASGGMVTNGSMYEACMYAKGYTNNPSGRFGPPAGHGVVGSR